MFDGLMKQFEETQKELQSKLAEERVHIASADQSIKITLSGDYQIIDLLIDPNIIKSENQDMIQDLIIETMNQGLKEVQETVSEKSKSSIGDILPGGMGLENLFK